MFPRVSRTYVCSFGNLRFPSISSGGTASAGPSHGSQTACCSVWTIHKSAVSCHCAKWQNWASWYQLVSWFDLRTFSVVNHRNARKRPDLLRVLGQIHILSSCRWAYWFVCACKKVAFENAQGSFNGNSSVMCDTVLNLAEFGVSSHLGYRCFTATYVALPDRWQKLRGGLINANVSCNRLLAAGSYTDCDSAPELASSCSRLRVQMR